MALYKDINFSVEENEKLDGYEIRRSDKMSEDEIEEMKDAGFRWSKRQRLWYARRTEGTRAFVDSLIARARGQEEERNVTRPAEDRKRDKNSPLNGVTTANEIMSAIMAEMRANGARPEEIAGVEQALRYVGNKTVEEMLGGHAAEPEEKSFAEETPGRESSGDGRQETREDEYRRLDRIITEINAGGCSLSVTSNGGLRRVSLLDKNGETVLSRRETGNTVMPVDGMYAAWSENKAEQKLAEEYFGILLENGITDGRYVDVTFDNSTAHDEYIRSEEFISKFGDWEKAARLEKLREAPVIEKDGKVVVDGEDITEEVLSLRDGKNNKVLGIFAKDIGRIVKGTYRNDDMNVDISVSMSNIDEIKNHHMAMSGHLEAIQYIPEIIKRGIFIAEEPNGDKAKHPNIEKYKYLVSGLKIAGTDYTCKSAIGVDKDGNHYYDQRLSQIEKGLLLDNLSQLMSRGKTEKSLANYDKRLLRICQCPQSLYLDKNLLPTKEAVEAVRHGDIWLEKDENGIQILHDKTRGKEILVGKELSDMLDGEKEKENEIEVNGMRMPVRELEDALLEDVRNVFGTLDPKPEAEAARIYNDPSKDGEIRLLVQYGAADGESAWREDALFDALAGEELTFNGMRVDVNPITPEKSGTIENYLEALRSQENSAFDEYIRSEELPADGRTASVPAEKVSAAVEKPRAEVRISPVTLDEILGLEDMYSEWTDDGRLKIFDRQTGDYIKDTDFDGEEIDSYEDAADVFDRLDVYLVDPLINDMSEQLEAAGVDTKDAHTLEEVCVLYKAELEKGNGSLDLGEWGSLSLEELNLAMGIVNPETVILPERERTVEQEAAEKVTWDMLSQEQKDAAVESFITNGHEGLYAAWDEYREGTDITEEIPSDEFTAGYIEKSGENFADEYYTDPEYGLWARLRDEQEAKEISFSIYQVKNGDDFRGIRFQGLSDRKSSSVPGPDEYEKVYEGKVVRGEKEIPTVSEELFDRFNTARPEDFTGRSMSVSDIILFEFENNGKKERVACYCDPAGFISSVDDERLRSFAELAGKEHTEEHDENQRDSAAGAPASRPLDSAVGDTAHGEEEAAEDYGSPEKMTGVALAVIPEQQLALTLELAGNSEEGGFYTKKLVEIAEAVRNAPRLRELDGSEQFPVVLRYFHPNGTESLVCEISEDGKEAFGYQVLNGDFEMSEFGYLNLEEIKSIPGMELDYHFPAGMTVERWLYKEAPEQFPQYAEFDRESPAGAVSRSDATQEERENPARSDNERDESDEEIDYGDPVMNMLRNEFGGDMMTETELEDMADLWRRMDERDGVSRIQEEELASSSSDATQEENASVAAVEEKVPNLKTHHILKESDVEGLEIVSDEEFSDIVDSIILNDYKNIPNVIRLPNLKAELSEKLGLNKDSSFLLKKNSSHIRPDRKGRYGQAFDTEEYRQIPKIIREANFAVIDNYFKNFQIVFDDNNDEKKVNKLVFNKDEFGNYLVTLGKVDRENAFSEERNTVVAVGVAPTIQTLRTRASSTTLRASATTASPTISQIEEKSNSKNADGTDIDIEKILEDKLKRGTGFEGGKERVEQFYRERKPDTNEFAEFLSKKYGQGGSAAGGIFEQHNIGVKGIRIEVKRENGETVSGSWSWNKVAGKIADLIEKGAYNEIPAQTEADIDIEKILDDELKRGTGFDGGKELVEQFYREQKPDRNEFAEFLSKEYGMGARREGDVFAYYNTGYEGVRIEVKRENGEAVSDSWSWDKIADKITDLIERGAYNEIPAQTEKKDFSQAGKEKPAETSYYVKDTAEFDLFAEVKPVTGLGADEAVKKYIELNGEGKSVGIGIYINGDGVFGWGEGEGAEILSKTDGKDSFYMGKSFVENLSEYDEHARNVLAAFDALAESAKNNGLDVDRSFIDEKHAELTEAFLKRSNKNTYVQLSIDEDFCDEDGVIYGDYLDRAQEILAKGGYDWGFHGVGYDGESLASAERYTAVVVTAQRKVYKTPVYKDAEGQDAFTFRGSYFNLGKGYVERVVKHYAQDLVNTTKFVELSDALAKSFETLDFTPEVWTELLDKGADSKAAIRTAAGDANLGDNLIWLLDHIPQDKLEEIFSDKAYAEEVYAVAKESVTHDEETWRTADDIGINGFMRVAELCGRKDEAKEYYDSLVKGMDEKLGQEVRTQYEEYVRDRFEHMTSVQILEYILSDTRIDQSKIFAEGEKDAYIAELEKDESKRSESRIASDLLELAFENSPIRYPEHSVMGELTQSSIEKAEETWLSLMEKTDDIYYPAHDAIDAAVNANDGHKLNFLLDNATDEQWNKIREHESHAQALIAAFVATRNGGEKDIRHGHAFIDGMLDMTKKIGQEKFAVMGIDLIIKQYDSVDTYVKEFDEFKQVVRARDEFVQKNNLDFALIDENNRLAENLSDAEKIKKPEEAAKNYILEKLRAAGVEVVQDREEFNLILESGKTLQKMTDDLSELQELSRNIKNLENKIQEEKAEAGNLAEKEKLLTEMKFNDFRKEFLKYQDLIPVNTKFVLEGNFELGHNPVEVYFGKNEKEHLKFYFKYSGPNEYRGHEFFDVTENELLITPANAIYNHITSEFLPAVKNRLCEKDFLPQFHEELKTRLESMQVRQKDILENLIQENVSKKELLENEADQIKEFEKKEARKTIQEWATKENYDIAFLNSSSKISEIFGNERRPIGVLPPEINQIFPSIEDFYLYAQKDYFIDHWVNHHSELTESIFYELQNVLDNYDDIYRDPENDTVVFVKQQGRLNDFVVVEQKNNKLVFYDSTFLRKGIPSRFEKITPARRQEQNVVEVRHTSSTAGQGLSDPAAGISTLNDSTNISQNDGKSTPVQTYTASDGTTYGFVHEGKIYLNPDIFTAETAAHEYTHLWDEVIRKGSPELWERGKSVMSKTSLWSDVKNDASYADIADDDDLVMSECHARIVGKAASEILKSIAERDGQLAADAVIDWAAEVDAYVAKEFAGLETADRKEIAKLLNHPLTLLASDLASAFFYKSIDIGEAEKITAHEENAENRAETDGTLPESVLQKLRETVEEVAGPDENGEIEVFWDYRDGLSEEDLHSIMTADNARERYDEIFDEAVDGAGDGMFEYQILPEFQKKLSDEEKHALSGREGELWEWFGQNYAFYADAFNPEVRVNLMLDTGNMNYDFTSENALNYVGDGSLSEESSVRWLARQQGKEKELLAAVEKVANGEDFQKGDKFVESAIDELKNLSSHMSTMVFLAKMDLRDYLDLRDAMISEKELNDSYDATKRQGKGSITLSKDVMCGLFDAWSGGGSLLGVELEKDAEIPLKYIWKADIETGKSSVGYSVDQVYGLVGSAWSGKMRETRYMSVEEVTAAPEFILSDAEETKKPEEQAKNYILEKLRAAGIEVIQDREEFNRILESGKTLQKMTDDISEIERLAKQLGEEQKATKVLEKAKKEIENSVKQKKYAEERALARSNFLRLAKIVDAAKDYIPSHGGEYDSRVSDENALPVSEGIKITKISFADGTYRINFVLDDGHAYEENILSEDFAFGYLYDKNASFRKCFADDSVVDSFKENVLDYLNKKITVEQQKRNQLLSKLYNSEKETKETLASDFEKLGKSLQINANFEIDSEKLGESVSVFPGSTGKSGLGIRHIIEERYKKDNLSHDEITALAGLILDSVRNGEIKRESDYQAEFTKNGIVAIVRKSFYDKQENWILTGFAYDESNLEKNREATETIQTVIAEYGQSDGYSYFRNQVGAVIASLDATISQNDGKSTPVQTYTASDGTTYGFVHEGKIYLNPDIFTAETAAHEYTHLWDEVIRKGSPELWERGKNVMSKTSLWSDVKNDTAYADIADDDDLVMSECHARIVGKAASEILKSIAERDGQLAADAVIDWAAEVDAYVAKEFAGLKVADRKMVAILLERPLKILLRENPMQMHSYFSKKAESEEKQNELSEQNSASASDGKETRAQGNGRLSESRATPSEMRRVREEAKKILAQKTDAEITEEDKKILAQYEGGGGLSEDGRTTAEILNAYYTPRELIEKVWQAADAYAPDAVTVLEPTAGTGRFAEGRGKNSFTLRELDGTSARIAKILHPEAEVIQGAFQAQFADESGRFLKKDYEPPKYDLVIGNPPYGIYSGKWKGLGEGKEFGRIEEYFVSRGLDSLKDSDGALVYVLPSSYLSSPDDRAKGIVADKGWVADAFRLPEGVFPITSVGTDVLVMKKWSGTETAEEKDEARKLLSGSAFFKEHPDRILGEEKRRTNRFGREETYVAPHEGLSARDELEKMTGLLAEIAGRTVRTERAEEKHAPKQKERERNVAPGTEKIRKRPKKGDILSAEAFARMYGKTYSPDEEAVWRATDWRGRVDASRITEEQFLAMKETGGYIEEMPGEWTHKVLFASGDIERKIRTYREMLGDAGSDERTRELCERNIAYLEKSVKTSIPFDRIHFGAMTTLAEEFLVTKEIDVTSPLVSDRESLRVELKNNLREEFILWARGSSLEMEFSEWAERYDEKEIRAATADGFWRGYSRASINYSRANISREDMPENVSWQDIVEYIDGTPVRAVSARRRYGMSDEEFAEVKARHKLEADEKRIARAETADKLFDRFIHEALDAETQKEVEAEYNRRFNSFVAPDYAELPLYVSGMSAFKDSTPFRLYDQQVKGISFLCNKGNGILGYDVGVGKTAAGIVATVNQIQSGRSLRPLIVVPNSVYQKWHNDIRELFPGVRVNDLYNLNARSCAPFRNREDPHRLDIPEGSVSLVTYEALKNISFTDESCEKELYDDFSKLLSEDVGRLEDAAEAAAAEKIKQAIGAASRTNDGSFVFFERCGWDNMTVDEAHNFKNLWTVPRPKNRGQSNDFSGIPTGKPSNRALKMYAMTQLVQKHNDNRNVFMLTATPFTNSPLEVYSMLSYVGRERLEQAGIRSLREFMYEFAHTKRELAVSPSGDISVRQVMKSWRSLPALQNILVEFIDKVDGEEAGIIRPRKFTHVKEIEPSDLQKRMIEHDIALMSDRDSPAATITAMNAMRLALVAPALADKTRYDDPRIKIPPDVRACGDEPEAQFRVRHGG